MSSIRLYILSSLLERGPLHGHALRALAEEEHIDEWTDISVGALYGALKRMHGDELIAVERTEREGNYPERHVYRITDAGRAAVTEIRNDLFARTDSRNDPFDLAFSRLDPDDVDNLADVLRSRRDAFQRELDDDRVTMERVSPYLWLSERMAWTHKMRRLETEVAYHDDLLRQVPEIIADEHERRRRKGQKQ
jgi:DNA-binding PadR family transcriptional regulator